MAKPGVKGLALHKDISDLKESEKRHRFDRDETSLITECSVIFGPNP